MKVDNFCGWILQRRCRNDQLAGGEKVGVVLIPKEGLLPHRVTPTLETPLGRQKNQSHLCPSPVW